MSNIIINPYNFVVGNVGAWKELGRTTLLAEADLISVTGLPNKRYYMLQYVLPKVSPANTRWTFNATTGSEDATLRLYHEADTLEEALKVAEDSPFEKTKIHKDYT